MQIPMSAYGQLAMIVAEYRHVQSEYRRAGAEGSARGHLRARLGRLDAHLGRLLQESAADDNRAPTNRSRASAGQARPPLEDLGLVVFAASTAIHCARIGLLAGDLAAAEEELRRAYDALASIDPNYLLPPIAELLAQVVDAQGRSREAEEITRAAEGLAANDDAERQALAPRLRVAALAWQERADEAEWRAREALDLVRIQAALARLTTSSWRSESGDGDRLTSDRRAWDARGLVPARGLTRERFLRDILANKKLPDGYARELALETLDIPEELFAEMMVSGNRQLAQAIAQSLSEEAATPALVELQRSRRKS